MAGDFTKRRALMLPEGARFDEILQTPKDKSLGAALTHAWKPSSSASNPWPALGAVQYGVLSDVLQAISFPR